MNWEVDERLQAVHGHEYVLWLDTNEVRSARGTEWCGLMFTDCTHPLQNVICDAERVHGWRESTKEKT